MGQLDLTRETKLSGANDAQSVESDYHTQSATWLSFPTILALKTQHVISPG